MIEKKDSYSTLYESKRLKTIFFILFSIITLSLLYIFRFFLWPFVFAFILYVALRPFYDFVTRYIKRRLISSILVVFFLFMLIIIPLYFLLFSLGNQAYELYVILKQKFDSRLIYDFIQEIGIKNVFLYLNISEEEILQKIIELSQKASFAIFSNLRSVIIYPIKLMINIFFMILILFFLLKDGYKVDKSIYRISPFPSDIERNVIERLKQVIKVLLAGNILIMILQGFTVGLAFYIFGIRMPLLWGSITAILSLIPGIGTPIVWLPVVIYFLYLGKYFSAITIGIWCLFGYFLLENILKPKFFGEKLNFNPLIFFFLLLGSIQAFNLPGVIIGPLLLTLFYSFWEIYKLLDEYNKSGV